MNKDQILAAITEMSRKGEISQQEILQAFGSTGLAGAVEVPERKKSLRLTVSQVLSSIGGLVICIGIIVLIVQHWNDMSSFLRILVSLGVALAAYAVAVLFWHYQNLKATSSVIFAVSLVLLPVGLLVTINEIFGINDILPVQIIVSSICFIIALISLFLYKRNLFIVASVAFGTWLYFVVLTQLLDSSGSILSNSDIYAYITMFAGLAYVLMGYSFDKVDTSRKHLSNWLYRLGLVAILISGLVIGGIWDVLYIGLVFAVIMLSVYVKNRTFLWLGGIFLMVYIIKITSQYFSEGLGWPFALVLAGIMLIAVGFFTSYIARKYISKNEPVRP
ncbi:TPA: hypothetical protein DCQ44_00095 [Candidatus Taylorbacteria bacterium]|nr:hypothetical protein [Candidatus Taylorbacteria bacterium]